MLTNSLLGFPGASPFGGVSPFGGSPLAGAPSLMIGFNPGDGFRGSAGLFDPSQGVLGGLGQGFGNPMLGLGNMGQAGGNDIRQMLFLLMAMLAAQQQQGMGGPFGGGQFPGQCPGQCGQFPGQMGQFPGQQFPGQFGQPFGGGANPFTAGLGAGLASQLGGQGQGVNPAFAFGLGAGLGMALGSQGQQPGGGMSPFGNQFGQPPFGQQPFNPAAFAAGAAMGLMNGMQRPGMGGPGGPGGVGGPGQGQGQVVDLAQGQTFTTPSGSTISWQGDTVSVKETGGGQQQVNVGGAQAAAGARSFGAQNSFAMAGAFSGQGYAGAFAMAGSASAGAGGAGAGACACHHGQQNASKPRDWKVWGDPHIKHPDGSNSDFDRKNALFTLQDGTRVLMGADNPQAVVKKVRIMLPGTPVNFQGYDPAQTSVMQDQGGKFKSIGPASQFMGGGFGGGFPQQGGVWT